MYLRVRDMKTRKLDNKLSAALAVSLLRDRMKMFAPKHGVDMPKIPLDQVRRDTLDAAFTLPFWDSKRLDLINQAKALKA
jgi:hypothetical protein